MPSEDPSRPRTVLVVCFGNLCRSPMAEGLFRARLPGGEWRVLSAGTHAVGGDPPTHGSCDAISRLTGIDISGQRSAPLTPSMLESSDFVFTMSRQQALEAAALAPAAAAKIRLLGAFAPAAGTASTPADPGGRRADPLEIADPMGGDQALYDSCCEHLIASVDGAAGWLLAGADNAAAPPSVAAWRERS